jgi:hypothetical protein
LENGKKIPEILMPFLWFSFSIDCSKLCSAGEIGGHNYA